MTANELRLGNWVKTEYKEIGNIKITEISESVIYSNKTKGISYSSLLPIPLTEEILLKCGFNKNELGGYIMYTELGSMLCIYKDGSFRSNERYIDTKIKHLHQLQNLYFCLVGKEFDVNFEGY